MISILISLFLSSFGHADISIHSFNGVENVAYIGGTINIDVSSQKNDFSIVISSTKAHGNVLGSLLVTNSNLPLMFLSTSGPTTSINQKYDFKLSALDICNAVTKNMCTPGTKSLNNLLTIGIDGNNNGTLIDTDDDTLTIIVNIVD